MTSSKRQIFHRTRRFAWQKADVNAIKRNDTIFSEAKRLEDNEQMKIKINREAITELFSVEEKSKPISIKQKILKTKKKKEEDEKMEIVSGRKVSL